MGICGRMSGYHPIVLFQLSRKRPLSFEPFFAEQWDKDGFGNTNGRSFVWNKPFGGTSVFRTALPDTVTGPPIAGIRAKIETNSIALNFTCPSSPARNLCGCSKMTVRDLTRS